MDNKNVSTIGIGEGIDYLEKEFIAKLDENVDEIMATYGSLESQGILSSANINNITEGIKSRVNTLQSNFDTLAQSLKNGMFQSSDEIMAHRSEIENQMNQGA